MLDMKQAFLGEDLMFLVLNNLGLDQYLKENHTHTKLTL